MARRYRRRLSPRAAALLVLLVLLAVRLYWESGAPVPPEALSEKTYRVARVVDGDTLLLEDGARVRLIGVDTPETVKPGAPVEPFGPEATAFTRRFVAGGEVRLQLDRERKDRYGRFLAYVWVDGRMLNEALVRAGLARARLDYRYSEAMKRRFRRAEEEAQAARRGIWSREKTSPKRKRGRTAKGAKLARGRQFQRNEGPKLFPSGVLVIRAFGPLKLFVICDLELVISC
jgi:micrococcal nuclease